MRNLKLLEMRLSDSGYYSGGSIKHRAIVAFLISALLLFVLSGILYATGAPTSLLWGIAGLVVMLGLFLAIVLFAFSHMPSH